MNYLKEIAENEDNDFNDEDKLADIDNSDELADIENAEKLADIENADEDADTDNADEDADIYSNRLSDPKGTIRLCIVIKK